MRYDVDEHLTSFFDVAGLSFHEDGFPPRYKVDAVSFLKGDEIGIVVSIKMEWVDPVDLHPLRYALTQALCLTPS